jgi:hypothetical protein
VYSEKYADEAALVLLEKCPAGNVTGVTSIRETRAYPVIGGLYVSDFDVDK